MDARAATAARKVKSVDVPVRGEKAVRKLFLKLCSLSKSPLAQRAYHGMIEGDYEALTSLKVDPFFYTWNDRESEFDLDYQIAAFFKKYQGFDLGIDREKAAFEKWVNAEESCRTVNNYFRRRWEGRTPPLAHPVEEVYHLARRKVSVLLGSVKGADFDSLRRECRHGPGSDLTLPKHLASGFEKFRTSGTITEPCVRAYGIVFGNEGNRSVSPQGDAVDHREDFAHEAQIVTKSRLSFVPKTARIDRAICVEPRWNVHLQLGIGSLIAQRLKRVQIDIHCQENNQRAAQKAYDQGLATLDLSSASDSIATNLVVDLLADADPMWLDLILLTRCAYTQYKQKTYRLEKISSMGNGYTFPLETLIFYALSWAACKYSGVDTREVYVYGDDIIVPRGASSLLIETLQCFGFSVNTDKSYTSGNFFESCGKDYLRGREVRPFFVKEKVSVLSQAYILHNQIVNWSSRNCPKGFYVRSRHELTKQVLGEIPISSRYWGPVHVSGVLHAPFDIWGRSARTIGARKRTLGWEGYEIRALKPIPRRKLRFDYRGHLFSKLAGITDTGNWVVTPGTDSVGLKRIIIPVIEDFTLVESPDDAVATPLLAQGVSG